MRVLIDKCAYYLDVVSTIAGRILLELRENDLDALEISELTRKLSRASGCYPGQIMLGNAILENTQEIPRPVGGENVDLQFVNGLDIDKDCLAGVIYNGDHNDYLTAEVLQQFLDHEMEFFTEVAVSGENFTALEILINNRPNAGFPVFESLLSEGDFDFAKFFVTAMPDGLPEDWLTTAMKEAVLKENFDFLKFLGENTKHSDRYTTAFEATFMKALRNSWTSVVDRLFGAEVFEDVLLKLGCPSKSIAAWRSKMREKCISLSTTPQMLEICLKNGGAVSERTMEEAVNNGRVQVVQFLLERFPDQMTPEKLDKYIRAASVYQKFRMEKQKIREFIRLAVSVENLAAFSYLVENHPRPYFFPFFEYVIGEGKFELAKICISKAPEELPKDWLATAMKTAVYRKNFDFLKYLGEGSDCEHYSAAFKTTFIWAVETAKTSVVDRFFGPEFFEDVLLKLGCPPESLASWRSQMRDQCVSYASTPIVMEICLKNGGAVNEKTMEEAVVKGRRLPLVQFLVERFPDQMTNEVLQKAIESATKNVIYKIRSEKEVEFLKEVLAARNGGDCKGTRRAT